MARAASRIWRLRSLIPYTVDLYSVDLREGAPMLVVSGLRKSYRGTVALDGFDLTVEPGEIVGLIGHNGAGKSTVVSVVAGLVRPDAGQITAGDAVRIGVAPQTLGLYPTVTVRENLWLF